MNSTLNDLHAWTSSDLGSVISTAERFRDVVDVLAKWLIHAFSAHAEAIHISLVSLQSGLVTNSKSQKRRSVDPVLRNVFLVNRARRFDERGFRFA